MLILQAQFNREDFQVLPSVLDPTVMKCSEFRAFFRAFFQIQATPPREDRGLWLHDWSAAFLWDSFPGPKRERVYEGQGISLFQLFRCFYALFTIYSISQKFKSLSSFSRSKLAIFRACQE